MSKLELNPAQIEAVNSIKGPVHTLAGPGSGKTFVIINRLSKMILEDGINPASILVITFTRAAAVSMRRRFLHKIAMDDCKVNFGTFHSIFFHVLKNSQPGITNESVISSQTALKIVLSYINDKLSIYAANPSFLSDLLDEISYYKECSPEDYIPKSLAPDDFFSLVASYNKSLREMNKIDFADMIVLTKKLLLEDKNILDFWQKKFRYILVDEFQDTNSTQYKILKLIAYPENNIFIVGDDDQSIYSFRGANPLIMQEFLVDFPNAKRLLLNFNYRSIPKITIAANNLVRHNKSRLEKSVYNLRKSDNDICVKLFPSITKEYEFILYKIKEKLRVGISPDNIAILFRTNQEFRLIAAYLRREKIPINLEQGEADLMDDKIIKPILALLKFSTSIPLREDFLLFCNKPLRFIDRDDIKDETVNENDLVKNLLAQGRSFVAGHVTRLFEDIRMIRRMDAETAIHYIRHAMRYDSTLRENFHLSDNEVEISRQKLDSLEIIAKGSSTISEFLGSFAANYSPKETSRTGINIRTYHASKGLEYDIVFIPDCAEGITPIKQAETPEALEEERRMFYVAMTRAKFELYISFSEIFSGRSKRIKSRFLDEIMDNK